MSLTKLSPQEAELPLEALREHLAPSRTKGLKTLIGLANAEGNINLQAALDALYPGKTRDAALNAFGVFRSDVRKGAEESGIQFQVGIDRQTQSAPSERHCWLEGEDLTLPELERQQENLLATNPEYRTENFQPPSAKQTGRYYPIFLSSSDRISTADSPTERRLIEEFLDLLRLQLKARNRPELAEGIWHFREQQDNGMHIHMQQAIQSCQIGLLLFSDAYMASHYIKHEEIPHFIPARFRAQETDARNSIAIMLSGCGVDDDPGAINRQLGTDHGDFGFQIRRWKDSQHFARCSKESKRRFAAQIADELIDKLTSPTGPKKPDIERVENFEWALRDPRQNEYKPLEYENNRACKARLERAGHTGQQIVVPSEQEGFDVIQHLMDWATSKDGANLHALLGELGSGKTFTCRMFARHLLEKRKNTPTTPLPVYIDLREIHLSDSSGATVPTLDDILTGWLSNWLHADNKQPPLGIERLKQLVKEGRLLVIFDGFDEISVRLPRNSDQQFLRELWRIATLGGKALISCRSHYFPTLQDQNALLLDEARGTVAAGNRETRDARLECTGSVLLPFTEEQIRSYLVRSLGEEEASRAIDVINATHNLRDLASRAYLLRLIRDHVDTLAAQREAGQTINAASLYRLFINDWLQRDHGKEVIEPPDKLELMERLAIQLWQSPQRSWSYTMLRKWVLAEFAGNPGWAFRYQGQADLVAKDLHTATFLVREGDENFRFAHSSLHEYFIASCLHTALLTAELSVWSATGLSRETMIFLGEQIELLGRGDQDKALAVLGQIHAHPPTPQTALLALDYLQLGQDPSHPLPHRLPTELDLSHTDLFQYSLAPRATPRWNLRRLILNGALANQANFKNLHIDILEALNTRLAGSCWQHCEIVQADFSQASLAGAEFRHCQISNAEFDGADIYDVRFRHSQVQHRANPASATLAPVWSLHASLSIVQRNTPAVPHIPRLHVEAGHFGRINACAFSPDGHRVLSGGWDSSLRLWDADTGQCLRVFEGHASGVNACAFSPDGRRLFSASDDRSLRLWDADTGQCLRVFEGHTDGVNACAFSPDGRRLLSGGWDNSLRLWDADTGQCLRIFEGHTDGVNACAFRFDGLRLVSASQDRSLRLWDADTGQCLRVLKKNVGRVNACTFSPDGRRILSAGINRSLSLWDADTGQCLRVFEGHARAICACAFSPDGRRLLSGSWDCSLRLWDADTGQCLGIFEGHTGWVNACAFSPDGRRLLSGSWDCSLRLWDADAGQCLRVFEGYARGVNACAFSSDGRRLLSGSWDRRLRLWDVDTGQCLRVFAEHARGVNACAFSSDGRRILSGGWDSSLRLWDSDTGQCLRVFEGYADRVRACAFSSDGRRLLSGGRDGSLRLWDADTGQCLGVFKEHTNGVSACAFSPDGRRLLSGSRDGSLRLWDADTGQCLRVFEGHTDWVSGCTFSPDGRRLLSGSWDGSLRLWDVDTSQCLRVFAGHAGGINACAFSPDGSRLLSASDDGSLRLWDADTGQCLRVFARHAGGINACVFSPDGRRLLSGGRDGSLRLWDANTGLPHWSVLHFRDDGLVWRGAHDEITRANDAAWPYLGYFANEADGSPIWVPVEVCDIASYGTQLPPKSAPIDCGAS